MRQPKLLLYTLLLYTTSGCHDLPTWPNSDTSTHGPGSTIAPGPVRPPNVPIGTREGVNFSTDIPFPQYIIDFALANRPAINVTAAPRTPIGTFEARWGEDTAPAEEYLNQVRARGGSVHAVRRSLFTAEPNHAEAPAGGELGAMSSGDTIFVTLSSWIDPDPSLWIYFGSYTHTSSPVGYQNVVGYTFVDQNPWASLFDETTNGWAASVGLAYSYATHGGFLFEQVGDHYAAHGPWVVDQQTYAWWVNL